jgi:hypothetical protein
MTEADLDVYATQFARTGFQGGSTTIELTLTARFGTSNTALQAKRLMFPPATSAAPENGESIRGQVHSKR